LRGNDEESYAGDPLLFLRCHPNFAESKLKETQMSNVKGGLIMSKHMQLTVTVRPYYQRDLEGTYPNLARHLGYLDPELVRRDPSLYELAGELDQLLYRLEGTPLREVLLRRREGLLKIHKQIKESLADWNLAQADRLLYALEDEFDDLEKELN
jgi:hypothetical protein